MPIAGGADRGNAVCPDGAALSHGLTHGPRLVWVSPGTRSLRNDRHGGHIMKDPTRVKCRGTQVLGDGGGGWVSGAGRAWGGE